MWIWITIGAGLTLGLSALISLALGALLTTIGRETGSSSRRRCGRPLLRPGADGRRAGPEGLPTGT
jgi:hypothetical protein